MDITFVTIFTVLYALLIGITVVLFFIFCWLLWLARREEKEREKDAESTKTTDDTHRNTIYMAKELVKMCGIRNLILLLICFPMINVLMLSWLF